MHGITEVKKLSKTKLKTVIILCIFILVILFIKIYVLHPEVRGISYYNNDNYYMVNVITGNNESSPDNWHFGAIKKEDYDSWKDGTATTVWVVSSRDENRGWRLRCNMISTITIYDKRYLPFNF